MSSFVFEELEAHGEIVGAGNTPADRAARIVAEAEAHAVEIEAAARRAGQDAGYAEGMAQAARELEIPRATFAAAVEAIQAARADVSATVEQHAVELAIAIAERIVGAALDVRPELVCDVVASALRRVVERDRLAIDVNPEDVPLVRAWLESQSEIAVSTVEVRGERRVPRGGCVVRTSEGEVDARVGEQLARAREVLSEAFAERRSE
jgi:flagellar biosynthesis/type III secretory pathway protein FliH